MFPIKTALLPGRFFCYAKRISPIFMTKKLLVSNRAREINPSPIRKFLPMAERAESRGIKIFKLNVGDPDIIPPGEFMRAVKAYRQKNLGYAPSTGILRHVEAWQKYYRRLGVRLSRSDLIPTVGCAEAIGFALQAVADVGDEVLVFEPLYANYKSFAVMLGIKLVPVALNIGTGFILNSSKDVEKKISSKTKAIVVINPDNPTGKLWSEAELYMLETLAKKYNLFIIADETYREIRFSGRPQTMLSRKAAAQNVVVVDSISKRFSLPGARIGALASRNAEVMAAVLKFAQARLSVGTLEQYAAIPLLEHGKPYVSRLVKEYKKRQAAAVKGLKKIKGAKFVASQGAFYQTVALPIDNAERFVEFMLADFSYKNQTVMATPMQDFYISKGKGQNEIRIAYVLKVKELAKAMDVLARGLEAYKAACLR